jgi:hypothetical protein
MKHKLDDNTTPSTNLPSTSKLKMTSTTTTTTDLSSLKPNVGVYTNPAHDLYVAEATPSLDEVSKGGDLKEGEVLLHVKSTGICGSDVHFWHAVSFLQCFTLSGFRGGYTWERKKREQSVID